MALSNRGYLKGAEVVQHGYIKTYTDSAPEVDLTIGQRILLYRG